MKTVFVGLSGGVDSSVAAALLQKQGYQVVGAHIINWTQPIAGVNCPWQADLADAKRVAAALGIEFQIFDFQSQYKQQVVDVMVAEYRAGRTPNPDVLCNQAIKFKLFFDAAKAAGADLVATGHYAQVIDGGLHAGTDQNKDQSYFLYRVDPAVWSKVLLPVGAKTKPEVRQLAHELGLPSADRPDSQGICFVGEVGIKQFLSQYIEPSPGPVILASSGKVLGHHEGAAFYTIGQRHGLGIGGGRPYYVIAKDMAANTIYVTGDESDLALETTDFEIADTVWSQPPIAGQSYQVRIRHRGRLTPAGLQPTKSGWMVQLERAERAVSPGQSAVVYDGQRVIGGGIIQAGKLGIKPLAISKTSAV